MPIFLNLSKKLEEEQISKGQNYPDIQTKTLQEKKLMPSFYLCRQVIVSVQHSVMFKTLDNKGWQKEHNRGYILQVNTILHNVKLKP